MTPSIKHLKYMMLFEDILLGLAYRDASPIPLYLVVI